MMTVTHSWANDQTYVIQSIDMTETSTGPYSDQRSQSATLTASPNPGLVSLISTTHFPSTSYDYFDFWQPYSDCRTNGWSTSGLSLTLKADDGGPEYIRYDLPLNGESLKYSFNKFTSLIRLKWSLILMWDATITGEPPFTYSCTLSFGRAYGVSPVNTTTFQFTVNAAQKGEITINPLATSLKCPVNTDCQTKLTVLITSTPGRISYRFGAHDNVQYLLTNGLRADDYTGTYDTTSPVSDYPIVVSAIVRSTTAGTRIVSVPISAELT